MTNIRILPEILSNKIAAGEVVERPASVVKELIENALDAGASRIIIEIENGGRSLIRVTDNGAGMSRDDALLSVERYATSKIYAADDLFHIRTLGFRGEALPSIASVSRFTLEARDEHSDSGTRIEMEGGKIRNVSEAGMPKGVMISVKRLFFNTPARRKFLKTVPTEMGHIGDTVAAMALAWPGVQFHLIHNRKPVKTWTAAAGAAYRAADILGGRASSDLLEIDAAEDGIHLKGWAAVPRLNRKTSQGIYVFVNGRYVKDRVVRHALIEGYSGRLMKGCFPLAALFIQAPHDRIDVNVHPTKAEVRFADRSRIHGLIRDTVAQTLKKADRLVHPDGRSSIPETGRILERETGFSPPPPPALRQPDETRTSPIDSGIHAPEPRDIRNPDPSPVAHDDPQPPPGPIPRPIPAPAAKTGQRPLFQSMAFGDLRIVGTLHDTYILCEGATGLILIDQHAAHERVLYENLKTRSGNGSIQAQLLVAPETIELGFKEAAVMDELIPELVRTGIDIDHFGGHTYAIKSSPVFLAGREIGPVVLEIVEELTRLEIEKGAGLEKYIDNYRKLMACHGSVRASQRLTDIQIESILKQLDQCENPSFCPHGRPVWIEWTYPFLEKSFRRTL